MKKKISLVLVTLVMFLSTIIPVSATEIEQRHLPQLPHYSYRLGKPEGVVLHDTANDRSTIENEISYMSRNWQNAFVHAFVDKDRIIETANTDYLAWGSGQFGNARYIQVELVHHNNKADVLKSIDNYAQYTAVQLKYYGLGAPDLMDFDGVGNVITHRGVTNLLGGTDHTDPWGYLTKWGISIDYVMSRITHFYNGGTAPTTPVAPPTIVPPITTPPAQATGQKVNLPGTASSWKVYAQNVAPIAGNQKGYLNPSLFNGITYDVLGWTQTNVALIKTRDFGTVQVYVAPETGATIIKANTQPVAPKAKTVSLPASAKSWKVYPTNLAPVTGNQKGYLNPSLFGGISYEIKGQPQADVVTIQTRDYGLVNIYIGAGTGAVIK